MARSFEELTGGETTSGAVSWVPADSYLDLVLEGANKYGTLSGVVTAVDYDMQACDGDIIQMRYIVKRTAQGPMGEGGHGAGAYGSGDCLSATSSTVGTQSCQIQKWGDYDVIPGFTEFEVCGPLRAQIMNEMSKGLARKRDEVIWNAIATALPQSRASTTGRWNSTPSLDSSCCTFAFDLYNAIVKVKKQMEGHDYNPDTVVMHPSVGQFLYFKEGNSMPSPILMNPLVKYDDMGNLTYVAGLKVIETSAATAFTNATAHETVAAVLLDTSRACFEAWGKRPTFSRDYIPECDYTKEVIWMYWGATAICDGVDPYNYTAQGIGAASTGCGGIGHVLNGTWQGV